MKKHEVETVIEFFGGVGPMSIAFDVGCETVKQWRRDQCFPLAQAQWVEVLSGEKFKVDALPCSDDNALPTTHGQCLDRLAHVRKIAKRFDALGLTLAHKMNAFTAEV